LHGRLDQKLRTKIHKEFLYTKHGALISTDVVARGIDIPDIDIIIQFDPPQKIEYFVHRVGRTARMGKAGNAIVLLREHEIAYLRLLQLRKVPISKQISIQFKQRLFSQQKYKNVESFICDDSENKYLESMENIKKEEALALTQKLQHLQLNDRAVFDKANRCFVSFVEAYNNHESSYIFKMSLLNVGLIANGMGLLYLPKLKRIKLFGIESFVKTPNVDFNHIAFRDKRRERERQQKLKMIQQKKLQRQNKQKQKEFNKQKFMNDDNDIHDDDEMKKKKHRKKNIGNSKKRKQKFGIDGKPVSKKQKRLSHKLREFKHYQKEEVLLKQLKRNHISQSQFDKEMGYKL